MWPKVMRKNESRRYFPSTVPGQLLPTTRRILNLVRCPGVRPNLPRRVPPSTGHLIVPKLCRMRTVAQSPLLLHFVINDQIEDEQGP